MFGRIYAPDVRDRRFPMRLQLEPLRDMFFPKGLPSGTRHYRSGRIWVQGNSGTCVEHGWRHKVEAAPIMQPIPLPQFEFYRKIILADEFPENDYEATLTPASFQMGTSVRAGAKVAQEMGLIENYLWAESAEDTRSWMLANFGGVVGGFNWTTEMMNTDSQGFIRYRGTVEGGHCVYLNGWSDTVKYNGRLVRAARGMQSWPLPWGHKGLGRFWLLEDDLEKLIQDHGEAVAATELKVTPLEIAA